MLNIASSLSNSVLSLVDENSVQSNAVDVRLDRVWKLDGEFVIDENTKVHRNRTEVFPIDGNTFHLPPGYYEISFENLISVAEDEAGFAISRSTLTRNGVFILSALYDSGYGLNNPAPMSAGLFITTGNMIVDRGTRIAQFLLFKAESLKNYSGDYGNGGVDSYLVNKS